MVAHPVVRPGDQVDFAESTWQHVSDQLKGLLVRELPAAGPVARELQGVAEPGSSPLEDAAVSFLDVGSVATTPVGAPHDEPEGSDASPEYSCPSSRAFIVTPESVQIRSEKPHPS
jgi:hypothetical protein